MRNVLLTFSAILLFTNLALGQTFNPYTTNIAFSPAPYAAGFPCDGTVTLSFEQGVSTPDIVPLEPQDPLTVTICITGFNWDGVAPSQVVSGQYASYFNWAFDSFAPACIIGTQNAPLPGTLDPNSFGDIELELAIPVIDLDLPLSVNINLQPSGYMVQSNDQTDDDQSISDVQDCALAWLPLTLTEFEVVEYDCNALLSWSTSQEANTSHADIYRKDGYGHFYKKIATVALAGNSNVEQTYSFLDETVEEQNDAYEYKIQFVDLDQSYTNSEVRSIRLKCNNKTQQNVQLFPNPASNQVNFVYNTQQDDVQLFVELLDMTGRRLLKDSKVIDSGSGMFTFNLDNFAAAQYIIRYSSSDDNIDGSIKFLKK